MHSRLGILGLLAAVAGCGPSTTTAPEPPPLEQPRREASAPTVSAAAQQGLAYLTVEGRSWMDGKTQVQQGDGCVSCHHVGLALWAHQEMRQAGLANASPRFEALAADAIAFLDEGDNRRVVSSTQLERISKTPVG